MKTVGLLKVIENMREYKITYWAEYEDEVTDFEATIFEESLEKALERFKSLYINYKRISSIIEK